MFDIEYQIGQEIMAGPYDPPPAVGDIRQIVTYYGIEVAAYRVTEIDHERGRVYGVIVSAPMGRAAAVERIKRISGR